MLRRKTIEWLRCSPGRGSRAVRSDSPAHQGRDPVGNGQAAAGFSAVLAPGVAAVEGAGAGAAAGACGSAIGVARRARLRVPAFLRAEPFLDAALRFAPARLTDFAAVLRPAALFFFFADFFAFFALFLAMADLLQSYEKPRPARTCGSFNRRGRSSAD